MVILKSLSSLLVKALLLVFTVAVVLLSARAADDRVHLISAESGGLLERKGDTFVGVFPDFFDEASSRSSVPFDIRVVPWSRAMQETEASSNFMIFPLTRTPERENRFIWITPLKEDGICFGSVSQQIDTIDAARKQKRVIVWRGTSHQTFLEQHGFKNLIIVSSKERIQQIFKASPDAIFYYVCDEQLSFVGGNINLKTGTPVVVEAMWLAGGKSFVQTPRIQQFVEAIKGMSSEKMLQKLITKFEHTP